MKDPIEWDQYNFRYIEPTQGDHVREFLYNIRGTSSGGNTSTAFGPDKTYNMSFLTSKFSLRNSMNTTDNKAVAKVEDQLSVIPNLFEAWYERMDAVKMIAQAGKSILNFLKNWRKPRYWRSLGTKSKRPETLPEAWLIYNFGLMPLVQSIDDAIHILGNDFPVVMVRGSSHCVLHYEDNFKGPYNGWSEEGFFTYRKAIRAYVQPNLNPNQALCNAMGLTSPLSTMFSVLPWGWAVNYFVNVSDLLSNFEDRFPGVRLNEVWHSTSLVGSVFNDFYNVHIDDGQKKINNGVHYNFDRRPGSLSYKLTFSYPSLGGNRFANLFSAIALTMSGAKK